MLKSDVWQSNLKKFFGIVDCCLLISAITFFSCSNEGESLPIDDEISNEIDYVFIDTNDTLNISICEAEDIASVFMDNIVKFDNTSKASGIRHSLRKSSIIPDGNNEPALYVINLDPDGWCIVSATKRTQSILAYSDEGKFDLNELNDGVYEWMCEKTEIIEYIRNRDKDGAMSPAIIPVRTGDVITPNTIKTDAITSTVAKSRVVNVCGPLLKTTWGQNYPYNYYCPEGNCTNSGSFGHKKAGCVAIAAAQIVRYWEPYLPYNFSPYLWDDMPNNTSATPDNLIDYKKTSVKKYNGILSMARLIHDIGVAVDMEYGCGGSGAETEDIVDVLRRKYSFHCGGYYQKLNDSKAENAIIENINAKQPVIVRGKKKLISISNEGHAWICDGYKTLMTGTKKVIYFI